MSTPYHLKHPWSSLRPEVLAPVRRTWFVETGTNVGHAAQVALDVGFDRVLSVEADPALHAVAQARFAGDPRVTLALGDSAAWLATLCPTLTVPCTFYLDAHAIEQNPLLGELAALATAPPLDHVILIDDVRMFGTPDWFGISREAILAALARIGRFHISFANTPNAKGDLLVAVPQ